MIEKINEINDENEKTSKIGLLKRLFEECSDVFIAIGDKNRQNLLLDILDAGDGGIDVASLAEKSSLSRPAVSHHLKVLKDAKILEPRKVGTQIFYSISIHYGILENIKSLVLGMEDLIMMKKEKI